ncbi:hypothetical protein CDAR_442191 [Caerostris darwini]|uniref:Uncharacterized protein n=1 Tax=Caerostris darwini TaxID=1538125 RepID=A0AAV4V0L3_9ARAC|nr:hypothetical protein CDAR_442191 [Caerostris darwini]
MSYCRRKPYHQPAEYNASLSLLTARLPRSFFKVTRPSPAALSAQHSPAHNESPPVRSNSPFRSHESG